jgi:hypothetical protein
VVEFVFTITQGRTGTMSLAELFKRHDPTARTAHEHVYADAYGTITPDVGHMRRFNTHGLTPEIAAFWTQKLAIHRTNAIKEGRQRHVETAHMNALGGLVEYVLVAEAVHPDDRFRFILLNRAPEKIARSLYERNDMRHVENRWLWYLDPKYPRKYLDATPYMKRGYPGMLAWYVREVDARKSVYTEMLRGRCEVLPVDIERPDWADIVAGAYGLEVPEDREALHTHRNTPLRKRAALERKFRQLLDELPYPFADPLAGTHELADGVGHPPFGRGIEDAHRERAIA